MGTGVWVGLVRCVVLMSAAMGLGIAARGDPGASEKALTRPRPVMHLTLHGDLDCAKLASEFAAAMRDGGPDGAKVLILELDGRKWRVDVVLAIAKAMRGAEGQASRTTIVYLNSPGHVVGTGQAALGMLADACLVSAKTRIGFAPGDEYAAAVPEGTDAEAVFRELRGLCWTSVAERHGDALLTTLVPRPTATLYAVKAPGEDGAGASPIYRLSSTLPASGEFDTLVTLPADESPARLEMDAQTAVRIGLCAGQARSVTEILHERGIRASRTSEVSLGSGLSESRKRLEKALAQIDEARRLASAAMDEVYRLRTADAAIRQRRVGDEQAPLVAEARKHLEDVERIAAEYPELMRDPPPGATGIGQTAHTLQKAWRDLFQMRRTDLEKLADRARTLGEKGTRP